MITPLMFQTNNLKWKHLLKVSKLVSACLLPWALSRKFKLPPHRLNGLSRFGFPKRLDLRWRQLNAVRTFNVRLYYSLVREIDVILFLSGDSGDCVSYFQVREETRYKERIPYKKFFETEDDSNTDTILIIFFFCDIEAWLVSNLYFESTNDSNDSRTGIFDLPASWRNCEEAVTSVIEILFWKKNRFLLV